VFHEKIYSDEGLLGAKIQKLLRYFDNDYNQFLLDLRFIELNSMKNH
jgi:hypothetical protein